MNSHEALDLIETIGVGNRVKEARLRNAVNIVADRLAAAIGRLFFLPADYSIVLVEDAAGNTKPRLAHKRATRMVIFGEGITEGSFYPLCVDLTKLAASIQSGLLTRIVSTLQNERDQLRAATIDGAPGLTVIDGGKANV